jgi:hypothetical protein
MNSMLWRFSSAALTCLFAAGAGMLGACGDDGQGPDAGHQDADFVVCQDTPAVIYMPGMTVMSMSQAYVGTLVSAETNWTPPVASPEVGLDTWVVQVTDAASGMPVDVTMTAEKPKMPFHGHGSSTYPVVTPGGPGMFTVSGMDFFMSGYWEVKLNLQPTSGAADSVAFAICIPD